MNIERSKNDIWSKCGSKADLSKVDKKLEEFWQKFKPAFSYDHLELKEMKRLNNWAQELKSKGIDHLIVIGIGGSSLGAKAIRQYGFQNTGNVLFWEGPHPFLLKKYSRILENRKPALLWISKSGTTLESRTNLALVREFFSDAPEYFVTSNPDKIKDICSDEKLIYHIPEKLGGRFSVVSPVGIMPPLFIGAKMEDFLQGFYAANDDYHVSIPIEENQAKKSAHELFSILNQGYYGAVFWIYSKELMGWGDWLIQLWAESIGKQENIQALPYLAKGPEDQHSLLQFFQDGPNKFMHIFCHTKSYAPFNARLSTDHLGVFAGHTLWEVLKSQMNGVQLSLTEAGRPVCEYLFPQLYKDNQTKIEPDLWLLGKWMGYWMYVVTYICYMYEVDPFDQPGVEKGKQYSNKILQGELFESPLKGNTDI